MLAKSLENLIRDRGISVRAAGRQIGVAHTTVIRILEGKPVDIDTLGRVCKWMGISVTDALEIDTQGNVATKIALLVERIPELGVTLTQALAAVEAGELPEEDLREIIQYATYKIGMGHANKLRKQNEAGLLS